MLEASWLRLARSFEFSQSLQRYLTDAQRNANKAPPSAKTGRPAADLMELAKTAAAMAQKSEDPDTRSIYEKLATSWAEAAYQMEVDQQLKDPPTGLLPPNPSSTR